MRHRLNAIVHLLCLRAAPSPPQFAQLRLAPNTKEPLDQGDRNAKCCHPGWQN